MKKITAKKISAGAAAICTAIGMTSCAYIDETLFSALESAASSQSSSESTADGSSDTDALPDEDENSSSQVQTDDGNEQNLSEPAETENSETSSAQDSSSIDEPSSLTDYNVSVLDSETDSESVPDDPDLYEPSNNMMYTKYAELIYEAAEKCKSDPSYVSGLCGYMFADIDLDNTPELLIQTGTCEMDRRIEFYTFDGTDAVSLGGAASWHSTLGYSNGVFCSETVALGHYTLYTLRIENGSVVLDGGEVFTESQLTETLEFTDFLSTEQSQSENPTA